VDQAEIKTGHADLSENEDMEVIVIVTVPWYSILHVQTLSVTQACDMARQCQCLCALYHGEYE
jgi:hypothetical protein